MTNDWGTDNEWKNVALHFGIDDENPKLALVKHIDGMDDSGKRYAHKLLDRNGIWSQALQIAKENDLKILVL